MLFHRARVVSALGLAFATPSLSFAADTFTRLPQIFGGGESLDRLQQVYQMVHRDPMVQSLLRDGQTHALSIASRVSGYGVETTKFQHYYKGVEVLGSMTFHHASSSGMQVRNEISQFDLDVTPRISAETAVAIAKAAVGDRALSQAPELKVLPSQSDGSARLIYWMDFANEGLSAGADVLVDAHSGKLVANLSKMETIAPVQVVSAKSQGLSVMPVVKQNPKTGKYELKGCKISDLANDSDPGKMVTVPECKLVLAGYTSMTDNQCQLILMDSETSGAPLMVDPSSCRQVVESGVASPQADESARTAASNSNKVLSYYKNTHGRDSFDGKGSEAVSVVHVGLGYANAAWVQGLDIMLYGDGDETLGDMTKGLDVAGHEMTHGVVSKTAKLGRMDESGALNEAYADFFGKMIAQDGNWVMGKDLARDPSKFEGIRDLATPGNLTDRYRNAEGKVVEKPYPAKVSEQEKKTTDTVCGGENDNCWVHFNSTVPGHAAYLVHQAIGKQKAEALYYLTLTQYLTSEANFRKSAEATMAACATKFDAATCDKVRAAFVETGML